MLVNITHAGVVFEQVLNLLRGVDAAPAGVLMPAACALECKDTACCCAPAAVLQCAQRTVFLSSYTCHCQ